MKNEFLFESLDLSDTGKANRFFRKIETENKKQLARESSVMNNLNYRNYERHMRQIESEQKNKSFDFSNIKSALETIINEVVNFFKKYIFREIKNISFEKYKNFIQKMKYSGLVKSVLMFLFLKTCQLFIVEYLVDYFNKKILKNVGTKSTMIKKLLREICLFIVIITFGGILEEKFKKYANDKKFLLEYNFISTLFLGGVMVYYVRKVSKASKRRKSVIIVAIIAVIIAGLKLIIGKIYSEKEYDEEDELKIMITNALINVSAYAYDILLYRIFGLKGNINIMNLTSRIENMKNEDES